MAPWLVEGGLKMVCGVLLSLYSSSSICSHSAGVAAAWGSTWVIITGIMSDYCGNLSEDVDIHGAAAVLVCELAVQVHEELPELDALEDGRGEPRRPVLAAVEGRGHQAPGPEPRRPQPQHGPQRGDCVHNICNKTSLITTWR